MTIKLDNEATELIEEFEYYNFDDSYAIRLAHKILELYKEK